jgi:glucose-6-phosphate isomerase
MPISPFHQRPPYAALAEHHAKIEDRHLRDLFANEPRSRRMVQRRGSGAVSRLLQEPHHRRNHRFAGKIRNIINIGIGGSDLGPMMAYDALRHYTDRNLRFRFVSNVDSTDFAEATRDPSAEETFNQLLGAVA